MVAGVDNSLGASRYGDTVKRRAVFAEWDDKSFNANSWHSYANNQAGTIGEFQVVWFLA